jgi:hypothetical protein
MEIMCIFKNSTQKGFCGLDNENSSQPKRRAKIVLSLARSLRKERQGKAVTGPNCRCFQLELVFSLPRQQKMPKPGTIDNH